MPCIAGFVLNKNETPFAPLYRDRYAQIKTPGPLSGNSKLQTPRSKQISNPNVQKKRVLLMVLAICSSGFVWDLVSGIWKFEVKPL